VWIAPGSPYADGEAVLAVIGNARVSGQPILGSCGGFQHMVIEAVAAIAGLPAAHEEEEPGADDPLLALLACSLVGEVRPVTCVPGTRLSAICGEEPFAGFHFCRFGVAPSREIDLVRAGLVIAARAPDAGIEAIELPGHPFYIGTMFQPQMSPHDSGRQHPLLEAFRDAVSGL
jgi:CTP synthase (UTP-ammonia lyase)